MNFNIEICKQCPLYNTTQPVPAKGSKNVEVVLIGEGPGESEERLKEPFCGPAGLLLNELLNKAGIDKNKLYITNTVKCLRGSSLIKTDKGWLRISDIVRNKLFVKVLSLNGETNCLEYKKITGYYRTLLNKRRLYKITSKFTRKNSRGIVGPVLTEDHPILTNNGYKQLKNITKKDLINTGTYKPSEKIESILWGTLLGDATLDKCGNFSITHCIKQKQLVFLLHKAFKEFKPSSVKKVYIKKYNIFVYRFDTTINPYLRYLRKVFYPKGKKVVPVEIYNKFNWLMFSMWYLDDGYKRQRNGCEIAVQGFDKKSINILLKCCQKLGLSPKYNERSGRIYFYGYNRFLISKNIVKFVPKVLRYKIDGLKNIPFDSSIFKEFDVHMFFDVPKIIRCGVKEKIVYDIEVEHNHNFVTKSCIVHNCRPKSTFSVSGNRAPLIKEIKACASYLDEELKEIKPKLIICLGNVAARRIFDVKDYASYKSKFVRNEKYNCDVFYTTHPAAVFRHAYYEKFLFSDLQKIKNYLDGKKELVVKQETNYIVVDDEQTLNEVLNRIKEVDIFSYDFETTGFNPKEDSVICISLSWKEGTGVVIPFLNQDGSLKWKDYKWFKELMDGPQKKIVHNNMFELSFLLSMNINTTNYFDTLLAHHCIDENSVHDLKTLALLYTDMGDYDEELEKYKKEKKLKKTCSYLQIPFSILLPYAVTDADCTFRLYKIFEQKLREENLENLFYNTTMRLSQVLIEASYWGIKVDVNYINTLRNNFIPQMEDAIINFKEESVKELKKLNIEKDLTTFNVNSSKQLGQLFFKDLKLPSIKFTKGGSDSVDDEVLQKLEKQFPVIQKLLEYRKIKKKDEYVEGILEKLDENERVHTKYLIHGSVGGRTMSKEPNIQNIHKDEEMQNIFVAAKGYKLIVSDYSQMELRVVASVAKDKKLLEAFANGEDIHKRTAMEVFGITIDKVDDKVRKIAKQINFGLVYGRQAKSLSEQLNISKEEAQRYLNKFFERMPNIRKWIESTKKELYEKRYIKNIFGRRRRFPNLDRMNKYERFEAERQSQNMPIQSAAADIAYQAIIRIYDRFKEEKIDGSLIITIHDSMIYEVKEEDFEKAKIIIKEEAEKNVLDLPVKFEIEMKECYKWGTYVKKEGEE